MKYLIKVLFVLLVILFALKMIIHVFDRGHDVNYSIGNFNITEQLKVNKMNNYYFDIKSDDFNINFQIFKNYHKAEKVITKLKYKDVDGYKCILPIFKGDDIITDIMCLKGNVITYYHDINDQKVDEFADSLKKDGYNKNLFVDSFKSVKKSSLQPLYSDNLVPNHYMAIENYRGLTTINEKTNKVKLFENDVYKKPVSIFTDKYYVVADYNEKYTFKKFYVVNLINGNIREIRSYDEISFDSIVQGAVDDDVYIFDKDAEVQYKLSLKYETVEKVTGEIRYYTGKFETMSLSDALKGKKFDNYYSEDINGYEKVNKYGQFYYLYKKVDNKYLVYRADVQNYKLVTYLFTTTDIDSVIYSKSYIYFKNGTGIYYYYKNGVRKVTYNSEFEFNDDIDFGVYIK